MRVNSQSSPFGSPARTRVLIALILLKESYPRELSRLLDLPLSGVQRSLRSLEADGLVGARAAGRTRLFRIEPRYFAHDDLVRFVARLAEAESDLKSRVDALRRRPRKTGKPL
jgi:sugar-specific transcriptional regulator TrmB